MEPSSSLITIVAMTLLSHVLEKVANPTCYSRATNTVIGLHTDKNAQTLQSYRSASKSHLGPYIRLEYSISDLLIDFHVIRRVSREM